MFNIRKATTDDVENFKEVIKSSILVLCKDYYTPNQLEALLGQYPDYTLYVKWIDERVLIVAYNKQGIVGFAQYSPDINLIEAIHVAPAHAGKGIRQRLVENIEQIAINQGTIKISLESSLNALKFYQKCGYNRIKSSTYPCKNGVELEAVTYEKVLNS